ncbi:uncharacterized protein [Clytia hemisphaerica]|uniref:uncharacterized protein isoform X2 n=1 Tax=Clytia hemisphaerica TaxID=252671 RepID=UPI0034D6339E
MRGSILVCLALCVAWCQAKTVAKDEGAKKEELYSKLINDLSEVFHTKKDAEPVKKELKDDKKREFLGQLKDLLKTASKNLNNDKPNGLEWKKRNAEPVKKELKDDKKRELLGQLKDLLKTASKNLNNDKPNGLEWKKRSSPGFLPWKRNEASPGFLPWKRNEDGQKSSPGLTWGEDSKSPHWLWKDSRNEWKRTEKGVKKGAPGLTWQLDSTNPHLPWKRNQDKREMLIELRDMLTNTLNEMDRQSRDARPRNFMANGRAGDAVVSKRDERPGRLNMASGRGGDALSDEANLLSQLKDMLKEGTTSKQEEDNSEKHRVPSLAEIIQLLEQFKQSYLQTNKVEKDQPSKREDSQANSRP